MEMISGIDVKLRLWQFSLKFLCTARDILAEFYQTKGPFLDIDRRLRGNEVYSSILEEQEGLEQFAGQPEKRKY